MNARAANASSEAAGIPGSPLAGFQSRPGKRRFVCESLDRAPASGRFRDARIDANAHLS